MAPKGRNVLVGGLGTDRLIGASGSGNYSDGSDLLVGGVLSHEANSLSLSQIVLEWTSSRSYADRTSRLASGQDGLPRLDASTVLDDGVSDTLTGGAGLDWYFAVLPTDVLTDRRSGERLN